MRTYSEEDIAPARGVIIGLKYSFVIWAILIAIAWSIYHW